jgi:hypothetical protein
VSRGDGGHPVRAGDLWLVLEVGDDRVDERSREADSSAHDLRDRVWVEFMQAQPGHVRGDAGVGGVCLGALRLCDASRAVQRDRVPDTIGTPRRHALRDGEVARGVGAGHLEAHVRRVKGASEPEVVHHHGGEEHHDVDLDPLRGGDEHGQAVAAPAMGDQELG